MYNIRRWKRKCSQISYIGFPPIVLLCWGAIKPLCNECTLNRRRKKDYNTSFWIIYAILLLFRRASQSSDSEFTDFSIISYVLGYNIFFSGWFVDAWNERETMDDCARGSPKIPTHHCAIYYIFLPTCVHCTSIVHFWMGAPEPERIKYAYAPSFQ